MRIQKERLQIPQLIKSVIKMRDPMKWIKDDIPGMDFFSIDLRLSNTGSTRFFLFNGLFFNMIEKSSYKILNYEKATIV